MGLSERRTGKRDDSERIHRLLAGSEEAGTVSSAPLGRSNGLARKGSLQGTNLLPSQLEDAR